MTNETKPVLLTEAELRTICGLAEDIDSADAIEEILRNNGLVADEPVDRLMADAKAMVEKMTGHEVAWTDERVSLTLAALRRGMELGEAKARLLVKELEDENFELHGRIDDYKFEASYGQEALAAIKACLAALRRGMEMRPELTRERVREALERADMDAFNDEIDALHAALTKGEGV